MNFKIKGLALKNKNTVNFISDLTKKNPIKYTACAIFGICLGVLCETINSDVYTTISVAFAEYLEKVSEFSALDLLKNATVISTLLLLCVMISGLCAIGYIFVGIIPFFKGLGIGCVCGYLYSAYAIKGVLYCAVLIFPASVIQLISLIISCNEADLMSKDILSFISKKENAEIETNLYILRFSVLFIFLFVSCVLYMLMCRLFSRLSV